MYCLAVDLNIDNHNNSSFASKVFGQEQMLLGRGTDDDAGLSGRTGLSREQPSFAKNIIIIIILSAVGWPRLWRAGMEQGLAAAGARAPPLRAPQSHSPGSY